MLGPLRRELFDSILDAQVAALPAHLHALLEEVPLIVEDEPSRALLESLDMDPRHDDLCGLHEGRPITHRSVEDSPLVPDQMMLFRGPILRLAGYTGANPPDAALTQLKRQVHITLLHEIGHHFGLDEDDLEALGYG
jgi:predicted Zn-dependent protease with MMP-like domain